MIKSESDYSLPDVWRDQYCYDNYLICACRKMLMFRLIMERSENVLRCASDLVENHVIPHRAFYQWNTSSFLQCFLYLLLFVYLPNALAEANIPPFTAEGVVSTEAFHSSDTNYFLKEDGEFLFSYSNGIWQIQFTYRHNYRPVSIPSRLVMGTVIDCKRIPDGIREIFTPPSSTNSPSATTSRNQFPPMEQQMLFLPWLSLCPKPELPMADSDLIRFDFRQSVLNNPKNKGTFDIAYIEPDKQFLLELTVTNNGKMFEHDGNMIDLPAPYNNGYVQFSYKVLDITNSNGIIFPLNVIFYQFAPLPTGTSPEDVYAAVVSRLNVNQIDIGRRTLNLTPVPARIIALDSRPTGLVNGATINYDVSNDQWNSLTNKTISRLATTALEIQSVNKIAETQDYHKHRIIILCIFVILLLLPLVAIVLKITRSKHNKQTQTN